MAKKYGINAESMGMGPYSTIRKGDWQLIYFYGTNSTEMYNLKNDIGENENLAKIYPSKMQELITILIQQLKVEKV